MRFYTYYSLKTKKNNKIQVCKIFLHSRHLPTYFHSTIHPCQATQREAEFVYITEQSYVMSHSGV